MDRTAIVSRFVAAALFLATIPELLGHNDGLKPIPELLGHNGGLKQCPKLQKPWNGQVLGKCDRYVGAECVFECKEPYSLVGSRVRICRTDGTWSGREASCELYGGGCGRTCCNCEDSTCAAVFNPDNGYTDGQCSPGIVGQYCSFRCNPGYFLEGQYRITCLSNGQWSNRVPFCRRMSGALCERFALPNGDVVCTEDGGVTVCRVICADGYMLVGSSIITCSPSGEWNEQLPYCQRGSPDVTTICPTLNAPEGGRLVGSCSAANTGDTCQLVCISGYRPSDTRVLICQSNGRWSNSLPRCISSGCPPIQVPNAIMTGACNPGTPGQSCSVTCQNGYTQTGTSTLICQSTGEWSNAVPTCTIAQIRSCPTLPVPAGGGTTGACNPGIVGQTCSFYCNSGYRLIGQPNLICGNDGRWSDGPPQCAGGGCPALHPPLNGANSGSCVKASSGQSCSFSCQPGYELSGLSVLYCRKGSVWSSTPPVCIANPSCPPLNPPENGGQSGNCRNAAPGQSCSFSCQAGYVLTGQGTLYCEAEGRWSGNTPTCTRRQASSCATLIAPSNGFILGTCAPGRVGETCVFGCNENYVLRGQRTLICEAGSGWSSQPPRCERSENQIGSCPILQPPAHGEFEECDNRPGGRCVLVCDPGYIRTGSRVRTCLSQGIWSGYAPTCTRRVGYTTTYTYKVVPLWSIMFG